MTPTQRRHHVHGVRRIARPSAEETFRRLTIGDPGLLAAIADPGETRVDLHRLDERTESFLRIGALVALDAPPSSYRTALDATQQAGAGLDDLLAVLLAVAGPVGSARVISAAPRIALAAGYDVEAALERNEPPDRAVERWADPVAEAADPLRGPTPSGTPAGFERSVPPLHSAG